MFPRLDQQNKNREYHMQWARAILTSTITSDWAMRYQIMAESYKFFNSGTSGEMANFLQKAEDGNDLPALWLTMSSFKSKIETLISELEDRGYDIRVRALNKEATSRKLEEKERLRVQRRLQAVAQFAEQQTGLPVQQDEHIPQTDRELDEYIDLTFKDKAEIIMESALKYLAKYNDWDETRKALFRDLWIVNHCISRSEIVRGLPRDIRVDPLRFIYDPASTDDSLSDSQYFGEVYYMGFGEAAERYNLSEEEMTIAYNSYNTFIGGAASAATPVTTTTVNANFFDAVPQSTLPWFKVVNNVPRVLVCRTCWSDFKYLKHKNDVNKKYGTEHLQEITDDVRNRKKSDVITTKMQVWRQCTLIGGTITREWGECPNQARDLSDLEKTEPPYKVWVPNFLLGTSFSKTEQVIGIELLRDIAMYNFQLAMNRAGAKGFIYDMALKPENMSFEQVVGYLKTSGILPVNSKEYQMTAGGMNVMKEIDLSITDAIGKYLETMAFLDSQTNMILGTSPERQGIIPAATQNTGVTQLAVAGSNAVTKTYFLGFERFCSRVLNHQAKLVKIAWANNEVFAPIIGDTGIDFLQNNIDLDLDEFGVFVESIPPLLRDREKLEQLVGMAVQAQQMSFVDAMMILTEPDTRVAMRRLQRKEVLRQMLQAKNAQAQQQQEAELQQRLQQAETQRTGMELQGQMALQQQKDQGQMQRVQATGRTKLNEKKLDLLMPQ